MLASSIPTAEVDAGCQHRLQSWMWRKINGCQCRCLSIEVDGATEAFAVEGSPADSVMLALNSPVFKVPHPPNSPYRAFTSEQ